MNASTVVVLVIVAVLVALAVRSIVRSHKGGACAGCSDTSCAGAGSAGACPAAARALADVEAKLGPVERE